MGGWGISAKCLFLGSFLALSCNLTTTAADASPIRQDRSTSDTYGTQLAPGNRLLASTHDRTTLRDRRYTHSGLSCVPFARSDSGIAVGGNAWQWWDNAAGVYARGSIPEPGSVLSFRANGRMRLGHVAVVTRVINPREIEIEHANWSEGGMRGGVTRNVPVVDVSEANDWTAVRVGLSESGRFGSIYPTYGFIYDRPDTGMMVGASSRSVRPPELGPAPSDLRPAEQQGWQTYEEVAAAQIATKSHKRAVHPVTGHAHEVVAVTDRRQ
jgi:hypothetical protein